MTDTIQHPCEEKGCSNRASKWTFPIEENPDIWLCEDHAIKAGFCVGCGAFCPGSDDSWHQHRSGLCRDCLESEISDDTNEYDADDDFGWEYPHDWYDKDVDATGEDSTHTYIGPESETNS